MADRIVKPDIGNDLVLQNDDASAKIEINDDATIAITSGTNDDISLTPGGTGEVNISKVDIDAGAIDGTTIATSDITVGASKTIDVSAGTITTSTAQKEAIVNGGQTNQLVPSNLVAYRASGVSTPSGWSEYTSVRGRMIVGLPSGGTDGGTVGTALTNVQDKSRELQHNHPSANHFHNTPYDNESNKILGRSTPFYGQTSVSTSIQPNQRLGLDGTSDTTLNYAKTEAVTPSNTGLATGADVTTNTSDLLAYIQLMAIKKD